MRRLDHRLAGQAGAGYSRRHDDFIGHQTGSWTRYENDLFRRWQTLTADAAATNPANKPDAIIAVIGELPYAEGKGDRKDLSLSPQDMHSFIKRN